MKAGTRIFLAASALFAVTLVLYYGPLSPDTTDDGTGGEGITDPETKKADGANEDTSRNRNANRNSGERANRSNRNETTTPPRLSNEGTMGGNDDTAEPRTPSSESSGLRSSLTNRIKPLDTLTNSSSSDTAAEEQGKSMPVDNRNTEQPRQPGTAAPRTANDGGTSGSNATPPPSGTPERNTGSGNANTSSGEAKPTTTPPATRPPARNTGSNGNSGSSSTPSSTKYYVYTIVDGDRLTDLASIWFGDAKYWTLIADANSGMDPNKLKIGQKINLPPKDAAKKTEAPTRPRSTSGTSGTSGRTYTIQSGDTLSSISTALYGTSKHWELIYNANTDVLKSPDALKVGVELRIPPKPRD